MKRLHAFRKTGKEIRFIRKSPATPSASISHFYFRTSLQSSNTAMKEDLRRVQTELNESKSLKVYLEQRLKHTESVLETVEAEKESIANHHLSNIEDLMVTNHDLELQVKTLTSRMQELESSNEHLESLVHGLRIECESQRKDNSNVVCKYISERNANTQLEIDLAEAYKQNESLSTQ